MPAKAAAAARDAPGAGRVARQRAGLAGRWSQRVDELALNTRDSACTGNKKRRVRLGRPRHHVPSGLQRPAGHQRMHMEVAPQVLVQVCSTSVKAPMPPSQRGLAANSVSVAAVHCISVS